MPVCEVVLDCVSRITAETRMGVLTETSIKLLDPTDTDNLVRAAGLCNP